MYLDDQRIQRCRLSTEEIDRAVTRETAEVTRLGELLRDDVPLALRGRDAILVDDGVITAGTILAAARSLRRRGVRYLELAVPVGAADVVEALRPEFDRVVCLDPQSMLVSVGSHYQDFLPVSEAEVATLLAQSRRPRAEAIGSPIS